MMNEQVGDVAEPGISVGNIKNQQVTEHCCEANENSHSDFDLYLGSGTTKRIMGSCFRHPCQFERLCTVEKNVLEKNLSCGTSIKKYSQPTINVAFVS